MQENKIWGVGWGNLRQGGFRTVQACFELEGQLIMTLNLSCSSHPKCGITGKYHYTCPENKFSNFFKLTEESRLKINKILFWH